MIKHYLNTLSPYVRVALDSKINAPWKMTERVIFDYEILLIKAGKVKIIIEDKTYIGKKDDIFLFKPRQPHSVEIIEGPVFYQPHIHFDLYYQTNSPNIKISFSPLNAIPVTDYKLFREDISRHFPYSLPNCINLKNTEYFEKMLFAIIKEYQSKLPFYEIQIKGLLIELLTYLIRELFFANNPNISSNIKTIFELKEYLTNNTSKEITLDELAELACISKYHLLRLFKKTYGVSPIHFHKLIRIEKAKELIQFTDLSLTEIAGQLGFTSIHSFSRTFKNIDKVPPSFYRNHKILESTHK